MDSTEDLFDFDPNQPLSIGEATRTATRLHRAGYHEAALKLYTRVLDVDPNHADALHYLGILMHEQGRDSEALRLLSLSVSLMPDNPGFRSNLGNLMLKAGNIEEADREYRQALALDPDRPDALNNYAMLCKGLGRYQEAEYSLLHALEIAPDFSAARVNLSSLYVRLGRIKEAIQQSCEAMSRDPTSAESREMLGYAYRQSGRLDEAAQVYRDWLADDPDSPKAQHFLAACTGQDVPPRASDAYIRTVFDNFANSFDAQLARLQYDAPELVARAVSDYMAGSAAALDVLDAGCGTGLCAPLLKPFANRLTGIDLSDGMLAKAFQRNLYDELHQGELTAYMQQHRARYDLVVSADTLVYFGKLDEAMQAAAGTLVPGGLLCFTAEALGEEETGDYRLRHHGRYAHARAYLEAELSEAGLELLRLERDVLRSEGGEPVAGWLVLAQRPGGKFRAGPGR